MSTPNSARHPRPKPAARQPVGRPRGPEKVKLTCWILPATRAALGPKPGEKLDYMMA
jgi:hypothetical protein